MLYGAGTDITPINTCDNINQKLYIAALTIKLTNAYAASTPMMYPMNLETETVDTFGI